MIFFKYPVTAFIIMGLDRTCHAHQFICSFFILHFCSFRVVD